MLKDMFEQPPGSYRVYAVQRIVLLDSAGDILTKNQFSAAATMLDEQITGCGFRVIISASDEEAVNTLRADIVEHYTGVSWFNAEAFGFQVTFAQVENNRFWLPGQLLLGGVYPCAAPVKE